MKRLSLIPIFLSITFLSVEATLLANKNSDQDMGNTSPVKDSNAIKITIVYDNKPFDAKLKNKWGFSCLIQGLEKTLLFDTGGDGKFLMSNLKKLNINPENIDVVFLSHEHRDHTDGLNDFLKENKNIVIYLLPSFPEYIKKDIVNAGAKFIEIKNPTYLFKGVASTGELGTVIKEQSLVIQTDKGLVIITGCAHPKIVEILNKAKEYFKQDIYQVIGGFHLAGFSYTELKEIIRQFRKLGVKKVGPCHCSGDLSQKLFKEEYHKDYIEIGVGKTIKIDFIPKMKGGN